MKKFWNLFYRMFFSKGYILLNVNRIFFVLNLICVITDLYYNLPLHILFLNLIVVIFSPFVIYNSTIK
jgi:hypothetical protein